MHDNHLQLQITDTRYQVARLFDEQFVLRRIEVWSPSHHTIGPPPYVAEMQFVHESLASPGAELVLCALVAPKGGRGAASGDPTGAESPQLPLLEAARGADIQIDLDRLMKPLRRGEMYHYMERVAPGEASGRTWIVFRNALTASSEMEEALRQHSSERPETNIMACGAVQVALRDAAFRMIELYPNL